MGKVRAPKDCAEYRYRLIASTAKRSRVVWAGDSHVMAESYAEDYIADHPGQYVTEETQSKPGVWVWSAHYQRGTPEALLAEWMID